jgi:hypothetical protein
MGSQKADLMADSNKQYNRKEFLTFLGKASGGSYYWTAD